MPTPTDETQPVSLAALFTKQDFGRLWSIGMLTFIVRWLEILAFGVYAYAETGSSFIVAMLTMLRLLPMGLFGMLFGTLAARVPHRTGVRWILVASWLTTAALLIVAYSGTLQIWHLALASFINGTAWAADNPFRRALIGNAVGPLNMGKAMSLDVGASNASRLVGPAVGGLLLATMGILGIFLFGLVAYTLAVIAGLGLRAPDQPDGASRSTLGEAFSDGLRAARASPRLAGALWATIVFNLFGWPVASMVPVIARDELGLDADGTGLLASLDGLGALVAAIIISQAARATHYGRLYIGGILVYLVMLIIFANTTHVVPAGAALFGMGCGQAAFAVMQATIIYLAATPATRTQAMGLLTMCIGLGPIGFFWIGELAERLGAPLAATVTALLGLLVMVATTRWWVSVWRRDPG